MAPIASKGLRGSPISAGPFQNATYRASIKTGISGISATDGIANDSLPVIHEKPRGRGSLKFLTLTSLHQHIQTSLVYCFLFFTQSLQMPGTPWKAIVLYFYKLLCDLVQQRQLFADRCKLCFGNPRIQRASAIINYALHMIRWKSLPIDCVTGISAQCSFSCTLYCICWSIFVSESSRLF